ncbi:MAG: ABC transporter permease [Chloroflexota bacterium]|nr:ABC transporter permease [Chloroflexota bacterium]
MNLLELIRLALSRLAASRLRAALTMLGVIIGVAAVISLVDVGEGATRGITNQLAGLGTNLLTINPGRTFSGGTFGAAGSATTLTVDDATAISKLDGIAAVAPELSTSAFVVAGNQNTTTTIVGTTPSYAAVRNYELWQGSFLTDVAETSALRVAVLGATTATDLGLGASAIGSQLTIGGIPFEVIGILQAKGSAGFQNQDDQVFVPMTALGDHFVSSDEVRSIFVSAATAGQINVAKATITSTLESRHGITAGETDDFQIVDQAQLLGTVSSISSLLTLLLAGIASISLVVGGIGIMNIMLVSVRERTREIGVRKAVGARRADILAQFLIEALVLSLLGGLIGIALGLAASWVIGLVAGWGFAFSPETIVLAAGFSLAVGLVFGVWPARQAARLDPVAALRFE